MPGESILHAWDELFTSADRSIGTGETGGRTARFGGIRSFAHPTRRLDENDDDDRAAWPLLVVGNKSIPP
uniref:Uncharacterized protein n=1 Tax=Globodera rostochiensis TaxID=31243 RepID=A0A914HBB7_GLORO